MAGVNDNLIPPKKGEVRNPNGKKPGTLNSKTILKRWLKLEEEITNPITGNKEKMSQLDIITLMQLSKARKGELASYKELLDRYEGKAKETVDMNTTANMQVVMHDQARNEDAFNKQDK